MDFEELLRLKASAITESLAETYLGNSEAMMQAELAKGRDADPAAIETHARGLVAGLFSSRIQQIDLQLREGLAGSRILCVVDFATIPYSFDVMVFLFVADKFRRAQRADVIDVALIAHESDPGIHGQTHFSEAALRERFRALANNMGVGAARLLPSLGSIFIFDNRTLFSHFFEATRDSYRVFPRYYDPRYPLQRLSHQEVEEFCFINLTDEEPSDFRKLRAPDDEVEIARRWLMKHVYPSIPVTLTLRRLGFDAARNSDVSTWAKVLNGYDDPRVKFVVLPDYYDAYGEQAISGPNVVYCDAATMTLPLRAAFYESAAFNIFGNNGPLAMGYLSSTIKYLIFRTFTASGSASETQVSQSEALIFGEQIYGADEFQRTIWNTTEEDGIRHVIRSMVDELSRSGRLRPSWFSGVVEA